MSLSDITKGFEGYIGSDGRLDEDIQRVENAIAFFSHGIARGSMRTIERPHTLGGVWAFIFCQINKSVIFFSSLQIIV